MIKACGIYVREWGGNSKYPEKKQARDGRAYWARMKHDMPPRGDKQSWERAVRHGRTIPEDSVSFWVCNRGHRMFMVGPHVYVNLRMLARMTSGNTVMIVCGNCHESPTARITLYREFQVALRAAFRTGGVEAVRDMLQATPPGDNQSGLVELPKAIYNGDHRWDREVSNDFPCSLLPVPRTHG